jgi:allantoin racemase
VPKLLIVNPNTTAAVTALLADRARALAPEGVAHDDVIAITATFGAPYIVDEASVAVASHALLNALASDAARDANAILVGCFGDPGLLAARELCSAPVLGLADAAMREAAKLGPFAIVTGGRAWPAMLRRLAWSLGLLDSITDIVAVDKNGSELAADPVAAKALLANACDEALRSGRARSIVIGGAALAGFAEALQAVVSVPLIDSVDCGLRAAWQASMQCNADRVALPNWFVSR